MSTAELITHLAAHGRYSFTTAEAGRRLGGSELATRATLRRLRKKGEIVTPQRGFHVIVPPEYRVLGCLPPDQFLPQLMESRGYRYYVGLLSAAQLHGAAHQQPQQFQVVTAANHPAVSCGRVEVVFIARHNVDKMPTMTLNTRLATIEVSSPEATALDLVGYANRCGGLDNVATVLSELAESLDAAELAQVARRTSPTPWAQRLGYLLEKTDGPERTGPLAELVATSATHTVPLVPELSMRSAPRDRRWRVAVNTTVEPEA